MSSKKFAAPLRLKPERSRILAALLGAAHLTALMILPTLSMPLSFSIAAGVAVLICAYRSVGTHVLLRGERAVRELIWQPSGEIFVRDGAGHEHLGSLMQDSVAHPLAIILNLRLQGSAARTLVLLPDSASADVLRQLRARLRMTKSVDLV